MNKRVETNKVSCLLTCWLAKSVGNDSSNTVTVVPGQDIFGYNSCGLDGGSTLLSKTSKQIEAEKKLKRKIYPTWEHNFT